MIDCAKRNGSTARRAIWPMAHTRAAGSLYPGRQKQREAAPRMASADFISEGSAPQPPGSRCRLPWLDAGCALGVSRRLPLGCYLSRGTCRDGRVPAMQSAGSCGAASDTALDAQLVARWLRRPPSAPPQHGGPSPRTRVANPFRGEAGLGWPLWASGFRRFLVNWTWPTRGGVGWGTTRHFGWYRSVADRRGPTGAR